jgi:hypothetical protein
MQAMKVHLPNLSAATDATHNCVAGCGAVLVYAAVLTVVTACCKWQ